MGETEEPRLMGGAGHGGGAAELRRFRARDPTPRSSRNE